MLQVPYPRRVTIGFSEEYGEMEAKPEVLALLYSLYRHIQLEVHCQSQV